MYQELSTAEIRKWLASLLRPSKLMRNGATLDMVSQHLQIPLNTLKWLARKDTARIGIERRRLLSTLIAEYENGTIDFRVSGGKKEVVRPERARVIQRYAVTLGPRGPSLKPKDRPRLPGKMPTMGDLLGK